MKIKMEECNAEISVKRKRKLNFSASEVAKLTELVEENIEITQSKLTNCITNKKNQEIWSRIAQRVTAIGVANRSIQNVKDKWKNMQSMAKKEYVIQKKSLETTGGGPPAKKTKEATERIFRMFDNPPGLDGFETSGIIWAG